MSRKLEHVERWTDEVVSDLDEAIQAVIDADREVDIFEQTEAVEYEQRRRSVYGARKGARAALAVLLQDRGLTGFGWGRAS